MALRRHINLQFHVDPADHDKLQALITQMGSVVAANDIQDQRKKELSWDDSPHPWDFLGHEAASGSYQFKVANKANTAWALIKAAIDPAIKGFITIWYVPEEGESPPEGWEWKDDPNAEYEKVYLGD